MAGLKRIILIDTHLPGVVELKLNGHTNICGTNASGKTTLQRLIPVFYGEYPSRVVPATRDSFEKWYLPRLSSAIAYEYERADGKLSQVVLSSNGTGVNYRLIAKAFDTDDYLYKQKNGDFSSVTQVELARSLKRNSIAVSGLLTTKDYRAIIQNDQTVLNQSSHSREFLNFAKMFSLCQSNSHIRHVEKLAKAVHSKEGKMETIKAMIAAILEEDGVTPPTSNLSKNRVEDWIRECKLIQEFERAQPDFSRLEHTNIAINSVEKALSLASSTTAKDEAHLKSLVKALEQELETLKLDKKQNESKWNEVRDRLNQAISSSRADVDKYSQELESVEAEFDSWQDQNIDELKYNVSQLPQWQNELNQVSSRYALITEQHQDVESAYNKRSAELADNIATELEAMSELRQQAIDEKSELQQQQHGALSTLNENYRQQLNVNDAEYQKRLNQIDLSIAEQSVALNGVGYTDAEQTQISLIDEAIKEASINEDNERVKHQQILADFQSQVKAREKASREVETKLSDLRQAEEMVAHVESLLYPGERTLLEFLRKNVENWQGSIGKVIRPELLQTRDLSPRISNISDSFFGLNLDLTSISEPEFAEDEEALQEKLATAKLNLERANLRKVDSESALQKCSDELKALEISLAQQTNKVKQAESLRKRTQQDRDLLISEYQHAVKERKTKAFSRSEALQEDRNKCQSQYDDSKQKIQQQHKESVIEHNFHWQQLMADVEAAVDRVNSDIEKLKSVAKEEKQALSHWLSNELNAKGVDVDEIGELKKRQSQLSENIEKAQSQRNRVKDYEHWYQRVFIGQKLVWQEGLSEARKSLSNSERELAKQHSEHAQNRETLTSQNDTCESNKRIASDQLSQIIQLRSQLNKLAFKSSESIAEITFDEVSINQRIASAQEGLQEREELNSQIKSYIEQFDQLIAAQAGTGLSDTWDRARSECSSVNDAGVKVLHHRQLVAHLSQLVNVIVPQKLQGLKEQGRIFGTDLTQFYYVLADIDKRILTQSKRISKEVDSELFLDGVSDSAVKIRSKINELEFWPELKSFKKHFDKWIAEGCTQLPSEAFSLSMKSVLDILGRAALSGGVSKLLDVELHMREGNSSLIIRTDRQLNESSSHGMAYLILCKFLLAFTRLLRGDNEVVIHWPIDEIGTLHQSNVKKIFNACQSNNINVLGAFPNPESDVLSLFENRYLIDKQTRQLQVVVPNVNSIQQRIKAHREQEKA